MNGITVGDIPGGPASCPPPPPPLGDAPLPPGGGVPIWIAACICINWSICIILWNCKSARWSCASSSSPCMADDRASEKLRAAGEANLACCSSIIRCIWAASGSFRMESRMYLSGRSGPVGPVRACWAIAIRATSSWGSSAFRSTIGGGRFCSISGVKVTCM